MREAEVRSEVKTEKGGKADDHKATMQNASTEDERAARPGCLRDKSSKSVQSSLSRERGHYSCSSLLLKQTKKKMGRLRGNDGCTRQPQEYTRQDKTRQGKARQDKTRQDKTRQDKTSQDKTRQE